MTSSLFKTRLLQKFVNGFRLGASQKGLSLSASRSDEKIIIPNRIPRSPTDILQALASTVGTDTSGPHYKYHDDPYLTPTSNLDKRSFSLSKESGRKAARWILNKHPNLFQHQPEDPVIEAFYPKITYTEDSNISEATIQELIQKNFVTDAIQVYQICQSKDIELSEDVRQDLLEFVSYYNCEDAVEEDWVEEHWYRQGVMGRGGLRKTWKDEGVAEELFNSLENKGTRAFGALIRGMSRYFQIDKAWQLYREACEKDIPLDTETYNAVLRITPYQRERSKLRWELIQDILKTMSEKGISPDLGTLNSALEALVQAAGWRETCNISLEVLSEFHNIGISPSLATYYYLLLIHCRDRGPVSNMLVSILDHIEGHEFQIQDLKDTFFFVTAMDVCCNHLKSFEVARRVDKLLRTANNYCLIGDSYKESVYHRHFFSLASSSLAADEFMDIYQDMVPHIYTPEPIVMMKILGTLKVHDAIGYLPQIWSDIIAFDQSNQEKVIVEVLSCIASYVPSGENAELTKQISEIAWDVWNKMQNQPDHRRNKISWSVQMISDVLITLVQCDSYERAVYIFKELQNNPMILLGWISINALELLCKAAINNEDSDFAVSVAVYAADAGHAEAAELSKEVSSKLNLNPTQKAKLTSALGIDIMGA